MRLIPSVKSWLPLFVLIPLGVALAAPSAVIAQTPPCKPCGGLRITHPAEITAALAAEPALAEEARLYAAWDVDLATADAAATAAAADALRQAGAVPWLRLIFRTPAPVLTNAVALEEELETAAEIARTAGENAHFQLLWRPAAEPAPGDLAREYGYLFKRASVAVTGARGQSRVITQPLAAEPQLLADLYAEEIAAYLEGVALVPAPQPALEAAVAKLTELDPGRALVLDALDWPANPWWVLPQAAAATETGFSLVLFDATSAGALGADAESQVAALAPLKLLAREFQGDLSLDPYARPQGGLGAWTFVRGEDLGLRVIAQAQEGAAELVLTFPDTQLKNPARLDPATGEPEDLFGQRRTQDGLRLTISDPGAVALLRLERMSTAEIEGLEGLETKLTVAGERQMPVEEILSRLQAFEDAQNRRLAHYQAVNTSHLRFQIGTGLQSFEVTFKGKFFFRQGEGYDWAWETFYVNGARWRGDRIPEIPLVQPEKAAALPLEITFTKEYRYRLRGTETVQGRDCWVVDFAPAAADTEGKLWQGTVWIDREHFGRVRTKALQLGLDGEVLSNEETVFFTPVDGAGTPAAWTPEAFWLPLRRVGQQLLSVLNTTTVTESETLLTELRINGDDYDEQRQATLDSDVTMVRDTEQGLRYLVPDEETGERVLADFRTNRLFLAGGVFYDESLDFPLPLAGINYFNWDYKGTGKQVNVFFGGALLTANLADPDLFGSRWDAGLNVFGLAVAGGDTVFEGEEEIDAREVRRLPARVAFFLGHPLGSYGKLDLTYRLGWSNFQRGEDTAEEFILPQDNFTHGFQVETRYNRGGYRLLLEGSYNVRSDWQAWGIPGTPEFDEFDPDSEKYTLWRFALGKTWWLPKFQRIGIEAEYLDGDNLDRFSKYDFGYFSDVRVHGFQGGKVRAESAYAAHLTYGFELGEVVRLSAIGDVAWATDEAAALEDELLAGIGIEGSFVGPWNTIVNLDLGKALEGPDDGFSVFFTFLKLFR